MPGSARGPGVLHIFIPPLQLHVRTGAHSARLAAFRKAAGLSQVQLAESLGIPQRTLSFYEREAEAIPSSLLQPLTEILGVTLEDILGMKNGQSPKRGPKSKLDRQMDAVKRLPRGEQEFVGKFLANVLQKVSA